MEDTNETTNPDENKTPGDANPYDGMDAATLLTHLKERDKSLKFVSDDRDGLKSKYSQAKGTLDGLNKKQSDADADAKRKKLEDEGNYKQIIANLESDVKSANDKLSKEAEKFVNANKRQALLNGLPAFKNDSYSHFTLNQVNYEDIVINPETGMPESNSVKKIQDTLQANFPDMFANQKKASNPPAGLPNGTPVEQPKFKNSREHREHIQQRSLKLKK